MAWLVVLGLTLFELGWSPLVGHDPVFARPVDLWLRQQPGQAAIIQYPLDSAFTAEQLVYTLAHGKPIVHGYASYFSFVFSRQHAELLRFPDMIALKQLAAWNVQYVLVETASPYTTEAQTLLAQINHESCLQQRTIQGTVYVIELVGCDQIH